MAMLIFANGSRNRSELRIRRHDRYEVSGIKTAECFSSLAARHDRNVIHISIVNHPVNRGRSIANREFVRRVVRPIVRSGLVVAWLGLYLPSLPQQLSCG
jgi:hypothetical protein